MPVHVCLVVHLAVDDLEELGLFADLTDFEDSFGKLLHDIKSVQILPFTERVSPEVMTHG